MILELAPDDLLTTTRSVRMRLDYDRPVPRDVVESCAQLAFQAPNGSNQQNRGWVCVDAPALTVAMADLDPRHRRGQPDDCTLGDGAKRSHVLARASGRGHDQQRGEQTTDWSQR